MSSDRPYEPGGRGFKSCRARQIHSLKASPAGLNRFCTQIAPSDRRDDAHGGSILVVEDGRLRLAAAESQDAARRVGFDLERQAIGSDPNLHPTFARLEPSSDGRGLV